MNLNSNAQKTNDPKFKPKKLDNSKRKPLKYGS